MEKNLNTQSTELNEEDLKNVTGGTGFKNAPSDMPERPGRGTMPNIHNKSI